MSELWQQLTAIWGQDTWVRLLHALIAGAIGWVLARLARRAIKAIVEPHLDRHHTMIAAKAVSSVILGLTLAVVVHQLGVDLSLFLGAAGLLTVALGFASQTAASNLISGLFLVGERPFVIGSTIRIGATTGEVVAIDLLSVKLRTADNLLVRIPNETLLKSEITNLSGYPIRRLDLAIGIGYGEDLAVVQDLLLLAAEGNPQCLAEPVPVVHVTGFGDSAVLLQFSVWVPSERFIDTRTELLRAIKEHFDAAGVELPFPQRTVHLADGRSVMPVRSVPDAPARTTPKPPRPSR